MLSGINEQFNAAKKGEREDAFIGEAATEMEVEDVLPGSDEEIDDIVDSDSVPDEAYKKLDKALDELIDKEGYDDTDVEGLVDGDGEDADENEISDTELDAIIDEACGFGCPQSGDNENPDADDMDDGHDNPTPDEKDTEKTSGQDGLTESSSSMSLGQLRGMLDEATKFDKYSLYNSNDAKELSDTMREARAETDEKKAKDLWKKALDQAKALKAKAARIPNNDFGDWAIDLLIKPWWWLIIDLVNTASKGDSITGMSRSQAMSHFDTLIKQINSQIDIL